MIFEGLRLQAISQFVNFDLERDKELNEIVELASAVTGLPCAVISFAGRDTLHFKVRKDVDEASIPFDLSFCRHAINQGDLLVIEDALLDERFKNNPYVIDGPRLRFYCGMPLIAHGGEKIGTLCVLDTEPYRLD